VKDAVDRWLRDYLGDGPKPALEVYAAAKAAGVGAEATMRRSKRRVGAKSESGLDTIGYRRQGDGRGLDLPDSWRWYWVLPKAPKKPAKKIPKQGKAP
jgi:hypothetical protein